MGRPEGNDVRVLVPQFIFDYRLADQTTEDHSSFGAAFSFLPSFSLGTAPNFICCLEFKSKLLLFCIDILSSSLT